MKRRLLAVSIAIFLIDLIVSGPRAVEGMFIPFIQLAAVCFPIIVVFALLSHPWRHGKIFQTITEKIRNFWKYT